MSKNDGIESRARRAIQALVEGRIGVVDLGPDVRDFIVTTGAEVADALEDLAATLLKYPDRDSDSYHAYVAADIVRAVATAVLREKVRGAA